MRYNIGDPIDPAVRDYPALYINKTIELLEKQNPNKNTIIVEIGSMRMPLNHPLSEDRHECCCDGHSSIHFGLCKNSVFYSVDINPDATRNTKEVFTRFNLPTFNIFTADGLEFLKSFPFQIDLLFLDAWDVDLPDSQQKHLDAYNMAKPHLTERSLILIDDTDVELTDRGIVFADGLSGKGKLVIPQAMEDGYKVIFSGRQTLLSKV